MKKNGFAPLIIILLIVILGGLGYLAYKYFATQMIPGKVQPFQHRIVFTVPALDNSENQNIYEFDLSTRKTLNFSGNGQFRLSNQTEVLSQDKTKLAVSSKENNGQIIIYDLDNLTSNVVAKNLWPTGNYSVINESDSEIAWSPDGKQLAFNSGVSGNPEVYTIGSDGNNLKQITSDTATAKVNIAWSPDGKKLLYIIEPIQQSQNGSMPGFVSGKDKLMIYDLTANRELEAVPVDAQSKEVLGLNNLFFSRHALVWRNNKELISFYTEPSSPSSLRGIWSYSLTTNTATQLLQYDLDTNAEYIPINGFLELHNFDKNTGTLNIKLVNLGSGSTEDFSMPGIKNSGFSVNFDFFLSDNHKFVTYQDTNPNAFLIYSFDVKQAVKVMDLTGKDFTHASGNLWFPDYSKLIFGAYVIDPQGNSKISKEEIDNQGVYEVSPGGTGLIKIPLPVYSNILGLF